MTDICTPVIAAPARRHRVPSPTWQLMLELAEFGPRADTRLCRRVRRRVTGGALALWLMWGATTAGMVPLIVQGRRMDALVRRRDPSVVERAL